MHDTTEFKVRDVGQRVTAPPELSTEIKDQDQDRVFNRDYIPMIDALHGLRPGRVAGGT